MMNFILSLLFYKLPKPSFTQEEITQYESLLNQTKEGEQIKWKLPYPKYKFLQYLSAKEKFLFHGSNHQHIAEFEPREQTLFNNKKTTAIFASSEPMWSLFYAVLDRTKVEGGFRNACFVSKREKFVYYSINQSTYEQQPWTAGMIYILPRKGFNRADLNKVYFDEWISFEPVTPLFKLEIKAEDFVLLNRVAIHKNNESMYKTLLNYKRRTRAK